MTNDTKTARPDAFKEHMEAARAAGRPELAHQSLGRPLSTNEDAFAEALMAIYGAGTTGAVDLAAALTAQGIARPSTGTADWTAENLGAELQAVNADLDAAYQEHGIGA